MDGSPRCHLEFRPATAEDVDWMTDVYVCSLQQPITEIRGFWDEPRERTQFLQQLQLADSCVVSLEGTRVGFYTAWAERDHWFLGTLCVSPEHQNAGIGAAAMRAVAQKAGPLTVRLTVLKSNPAARRFYERLGCRQVASTERHDHFAWLASARA